MPWVCQAGGTLLVPSGETHHLFVVLNSPVDFETYPLKSCVLVSFSSIRLGPYDRTKVVQPGIHPFIQVPSFVAYRHPRMEISTVLEERANSGVYVPREPVTEALRQDLIAGLYASPFTPRYLKLLKIT